MLSSDVAYATTIPVPGSSTSCVGLFAGIGLPNVNVEVKNLDTGDIETDVTNADGDYQVNIPFGRLAITPTKQCTTWQCWVNGVTTFDLVFILKHINHLDMIGCPFRRIAANADNDDKITQLDIDLIQTLILRRIESLPNVPSWRFVSNEYFLFSGAGFQNFDPAFPFVFWDMLGNFDNPMPAIYHYLSDTYDYNGNPSWVDKLNEREFIKGDVFNHWEFFALKVGDINGNANLTKSLGSREDRIVQIAYPNNESHLERGKEYLINLRVRDFKDLTAYQLGFMLNPNLVEILEVKEGDMPAFDRDNFGLTRLREGELRTLWLEPEVKPLSFKGSPVLLTIKVKAKDDIDYLSDILELKKDVLPAEFYYADGSLVNVTLEMEVQANEFRKLATSPDIENYPNPFNDRTTIVFRMPESGIAKVTVKDALGRILLVSKNFFEKGYNEYSIDRTDDFPTGILFYSIEAGDFKATGRMMKIK